MESLPGTPPTGEASSISSDSLLIIEPALHREAEVLDVPKTNAAGRIGFANPRMASPGKGVFLFAGFMTLPQKWETTKKGVVNMVNQVLQLKKYYTN